jgi:hypothetical protein
MRIRSKLTTIALAAGLVVGGVAGPAQAATTGDTTATFTITAGALAITVPGSATLSTVATGAGTSSGQLGNVTVADTRGALVNSWTATIDSTTFVRDGGTATSNETVAVDQIAYSSGASTAHTGLGAFVPGTLINGTLPGTGGAHTGFAGNSSTTWNPTLTLTLLSSQVAGTYTGTVTHSVA